MRIVISTGSRTPIYEQIKDQVRTSILSGDLQAGQTLPSLRQLAADIRVSVITVTRAYNDLVAEGLVESAHGRGFVVLEIEPNVASSALESRVDELLHDIRRAAHHAHLSKADVHHRLDEIWRNHD